MLLNRAHLNAHLATSKVVTRPGLQSVQIEPGRVCASDGSIAVKMEFMSVSNLPHNAPEGTRSPTEPVLVPTDAIKAILKGQKKGQLYTLCVNGTMGYLLAGESMVGFTLLDEQYPDIDAVYPPYDEEIENPHLAAYNPAYLDTVNKLYKAFDGPTYQPAVTMTARGDKRAASFEWTSEETAVHVILMPVRKS
jgi:hypothetical protein